MANLNDAVFEIDAGKILAKLHLAGQLAVENNAIAINTGIKNHVKKADPKKPGNVEFDLENKSGEYLLALIRKLEYLVPIDPNKNKSYIKAKAALDKFMKDHEKDFPKKDKIENKEDSKNQNEKKNEEKDKEQQKKNENTSLIDKNIKLKTTVNDSIQMQSFLEYLTEADDKDNKRSEKLLRDLEKIQAPLIKLYDEYGLEKYLKVQDKNDKDKTDYDATAKSFETALTEVNKTRISEKKRLVDDLKKVAINDLKTYFLSFAGKENQAKIKESDIAVVNVTADKDIEDPKVFEKMIKDYKLSVDDIDKQILQNQDKLQNEPAKISKELYKNDVAVVIKYEVEIETM